MERSVQFGYFNIVCMCVYKMYDAHTSASELMKMHNINNLKSSTIMQWGNLKVCEISV
jgi:hypothetical protein